MSEKLLLHGEQCSFGICYEMFWIARPNRATDDPEHDIAILAILFVHASQMVFRECAKSVLAPYTGYLRTWVRSPSMLLLAELPCLVKHVCVAIVNFLLTTLITFSPHLMRSGSRQCLRMSSIV
jgi:hypothetical protein